MWHTSFSREQMDCQSMPGLPRAKILAALMVNKRKHVCVCLEDIEPVKVSEAFLGGRLTPRVSTELSFPGLDAGLGGWGNGREKCCD